MQIPEAILAAAYKWALAHAGRQARGNAELGEVLIDAATDAVLWSVEHCSNVETFPQFCKRAVQRWVGRKLGKALRKRDRRPDVGELPEQVEGRTEKPTGPLPIDDLPEDLAFIVRLYMVDGYTCRDIGLLVGQSHNTVNLKLKLAAELLAEGRMKKPKRRKGEKRLTAG